MSNDSCHETGSCNVASPFEKDYYRESLETYNSWMLTGRAWPVLSITILYLVFVLRVGPQLMKNRKPMNIRKVILFYNLYQTVSNANTFSMLFTVPGAIDHLYTYTCHPMERSKNPYCMNVADLGWRFLFSKTLDLLDTVFFVLKKKNSQITFLHLYHHTNMVVMTWYFAKYHHAEQMIIPVLINTFIHVIMYAYYFLAAIGPQMQPYLWWKSYVTKLQMLQFVIILLYMLALLFFDCSIPHVNLMLIAFIQIIIFLTLFFNFYYKTYIARKKEIKAIADRKAMKSKTK